MKNLLVRLHFIIRLQQVQVKLPSFQEKVTNGIVISFNFICAKAGNPNVKLIYDSDRDSSIVLSEPKVGSPYIGLSDLRESIFHSSALRFLVK